MIQKCIFENQRLQRESVPFDGFVDEALKAIGRFEMIEAVEAGGGSALTWSDDGGVVMLGPGRIRITGSDKWFATEIWCDSTDQVPHDGSVLVVERPRFGSGATVCALGQRVFKLSSLLGVR